LYCLGQCGFDCERRQGADDVVRMHADQIATFAAVDVGKWKLAADIENLGKPLCYKAL